MNEFILASDKVYIYFDFSWALVDAVKALPKRSWEKDKTGKPWVAPLVVENVQPLLQLAKEHSFYVPDDVTNALGQAQDAHKRNLETSNALEGGVEVKGLGGELMPFQKVGVEYIVRNKRVLTGDQTGLGKSIEALASIHHLNAYPALVICPASLKLNWEKETNKWLPGKVVTVLEGTTPYEYESDVVIINYAILDAWKNHLLDWFEMVVADESHYCKNKDSGRSKAAKKIFQTVPCRLLLSATPIENRPKELVHQLDILGQLDKFGGAWSFLQRYCDAKKDSFWTAGGKKTAWNFDGASHMKELHDKMRATCYIRRTKQQVMTELPPVQRSMIPIEIDNQKEYKEVAATVRLYLKERAEERVYEDDEFLQDIAGMPDKEQSVKIQKRQRWIYNKSLYAEALVEIERLKQVSARGKLATVIKWVKDFLESGEKIILFAVHKEIVSILVEEFDAPTIIGGQSKQSVEDAKDQFQNDPDTKVIVCNLSAGGLGHTLTAASHVAFVEMGWTPTEHKQATARCYGRVNDPHGANEYWFVGKDTVDESIYKLLQKKRQVVDAITDGKDAEKINVVSELMEILKNDTSK